MVPFSGTATPGPPPAHNGSAGGRGQRKPPTRPHGFPNELTAAATRCPCCRSPSARGTSPAMSSTTVATRWVVSPQAPPPATAGLFMGAFQGRFPGRLRLSALAGYSACWAPPVRGAPASALGDTARPCTHPRLVLPIKHYPSKNPATHPPHEKQSNPPTPADLSLPQLPPLARPGRQACAFLSALRPVPRHHRV